MHNLYYIDNQSVHGSNFNHLLYIYAHAWAPKFPITFCSGKTELSHIRVFKLVFLLLEFSLILGMESIAILIGPWDIQILHLLTFSVELWEG